MTTSKQLITILLCSLATLITRFLPFIIFKGDKPTPKYMKYLGDALPASIFVMLVVYCLKDINIMSGNHAIPELIAIISTVLVHLYKRETLLSIAIGTAIYMLLIQFVFI